MSRRKPSPEAIFLARRFAHRNRLEGAGMSAETAESWLTAWEGEARRRGLDTREAAFWDPAEDWIAEQRRGR
jgi:hypothetical protein